MPAEIDFLLKRLAGLLGPENISEADGKIIVRPVSVREAAGVIDLAGGTGVSVEPANYTLGPTVSTGRGVKIILSLERMNKIRRFDRQSLCLTVEPAVAAGEILKIAAENGLFFPGEDCLHGRATVGENVADCFSEGVPDFKCQSACIDGLEMLLLDGGTVTIDASCVRGGDNYSLSYLVSGYRESPAVITALHLKMLPARTGEYFLVAAFKQFDDAVKSLPALAARRDRLKKAIIVGAAFASRSTDYLKNLFPGMEDHGAYALFALADTPSGLEPAFREIAAACPGLNDGEVFVAGATSEREMLSAVFDSFLTDLTDMDLSTGGDFPAQGEIYHQDRVYRLKAVAWQGEPRAWKGFYGP